MSDLDQTFAQYVERIGQNKDLMDQFVHGGPEDTVQTEGGPIPTLAGISKAVSESGGYPMYVDTETGIASTIEGQYFKTPSVEEHEAEIIYRHEPGGVAFELARTPSTEWVESPLTKNERFYDLVNRVRFVPGEIDGAYYAPDLSERPGLEYSIASGALNITGAGAGAYPSIFWLGHVRKAERNTEVVMRLTLSDDYAGAGGPGPQVFFGDVAADLRGILFANNGQIYVHNRVLTGTGEGSTAVDPSVAFGLGDEVELKIVLRSDGTGFAIGTNITAGTSLTLSIADTSTIQPGRIWVGYNRDTPESITHFGVRELDVIPEDFDQASVLADISELQADVTLLEQQAQDRLVPHPFPDGFAMYDEIGFQIYRGLSSKQFVTDFNPDSRAVVTSSSYYVDGAAGSDANDGSEGSPFQTLQKAIEAANLGGAATTIYAKSGEYGHDITGVLPALSVDFNLICADESPAEFTLASTESGWQADGTYTNLWKVTVSGAAPLAAYDKGNLDEYGTPRGLIERPLADADSTPGSFSVSGSDIYVRLYDDRAPDANVRVVRDLPGLNAANRLFYLKNIIIRGGSGNAFVCSDRNGSSCASGCAFTHGQMAAFRFVRNSGSSVLMHNCEAAWARDSDGFSYSTAGSGCDVVEIGCIGHHNGLESGSTQNGSTVHKAIRCLRINCEHKYNWNKNIADTGSNTQSWNLGVVAGSALDPGGITRSLNFVVADSAQMWLDSCISDGGSAGDFAVEDSASIMHVKNTDTVNFKINVEVGTLKGY